MLIPRGISTLKFHVIMNLSLVKNNNLSKNNWTFMQFHIRIIINNIIYFFINF